MVLKNTKIHHMKKENYVFKDIDAQVRHLLKVLIFSIFHSYVSLQKVCSELKKLLAAKQEIYVLKCWGFLVQIFGEVNMSSLNMITVMFQSFRTNRSKQTV